MKIIFVLAMLVPAIFADVKRYQYLHNGDADCQARYTYHYNNHHLQKDIFVQYQVDILVRVDKDHANALLVFFRDFKGTTPHQTDTHPVRVTFDDSGKIVKFENHPEETDFLYHFKKSILKSIQLDTAQVNAHKDSHDGASFHSDITDTHGKTCNIEYHVHRLDDDRLEVRGVRDVTKCNPASSNTYAKYKDSRKTWDYHFDKSIARNLLHLDIHAENFFAADQHLVHKIGLNFNWCEKPVKVWDVSGLAEEIRTYKAPYSLE